MTITPAQLQPIAAAWQTALNQLNALILASIVSPPGASIAGPNSASNLVDAQGGVWTLGGNDANGYYSTLLNGIRNGSGQSLTIDINGVIFNYYPTRGWYHWQFGIGWTTSGSSTGPVIS